jgi:hypothetical protein
MGYTHYWKTSTEAATQLQKAWPFILRDAKAYCDEVAKRDGVVIQFEDDDDSPAVFSESDIRFNGAGCLGHETFVLHNSPSKFAFCKTAGKPYDVMVLGVLAIAKHYAPLLDVTSDGFGVSTSGERYCGQEVGLVAKALARHGYMMEFDHRMNLIETTFNANLAKWTAILELAAVDL